MALNDTILKDMTTAMKEQDKFNLSVLRMLKSALQLEKINLKHTKCQKMVSTRLCNHHFPLDTIPLI